MGPIHSSAAVGYFHPINAEEKLIVGTAGGLRAYRASNGDLLWTALSGEVRGSPAIGPASASYVGNGNQVQALLQDGVPSWSIPLDGQVVGSPVIGNFTSSGNWVIHVGTTAGTLWAIRALPQSTVQWSRSLPSVRGGVAVDGSGVVFVGGEGAVFAVAGGQLSFTMPLPGETVTSPPAIGPDGTLYFTTNQKLHALRHVATPPGSVWPMFHRDARRIGNGTVITLIPKGLSPDGRFQFRLENPFASPVFIDASEDLVNWEELTSIGAFQAFDLVDPATSTTPKRFFRARVP